MSDIQETFIAMMDAYMLEVAYPRLGYSCDSCIYWERNHMYGNDMGDGRCAVKSSEAQEDVDTKSDYLCLEYRHA